MTRSSRCSVSTLGYTQHPSLSVSTTLSLLPLCSPPNMTFTLWFSPLSRVFNIIIESVRAEAPAQSPPSPSPSLLVFALSMLSDRQDHSWVPPTPLLPPFPPVFMLCCKNGDVFSSHWLKKKNNWTNRKVKAVVLLCYSGENNGDLCAIIFFAKCSRLFFHQVMILKRLCSKYLMLWITVKTCMLFTPYDDFLKIILGTFPCVMCVIFDLI